MQAAKILVMVTALVFISYGVLFLLFPSCMLTWVTNSTVTTSSALIDIRATYGGMSLAVGIVLLLLARRAQTLGVGLTMTFILMLGMALGRIIGMLFDGQANQVMFVYLALELLVVVVSAYLIKVAYDD